MGKGIPHSACRPIRYPARFISLVPRFEALLSGVDMSDAAPITGVVFVLSRFFRTNWPPKLLSSGVRYPYMPWATSSSTSSMDWIGGY